MSALIALAVALLLITVWWLARPLRVAAPASADAAVSERAELLQLRDRLIAQLNELDAERADRGMDADSATEEEARLSGELAAVLKQLDASAKAASAKAAAPATARAPWLTTGALAGLLLIVGGGLYTWQNAANLKGFMQAAESGANSARVPPMVFEMVTRLEQRLQDNPNDADGWARLGRAYAVMERTGDALAAYARSYELAPDNVEMLADYAWILFNQDPSVTTGRVNELYTRLNKLQPQHPDALWFLGFAAYQRGEFRAAVSKWEALLKLIPPEDPGRQHLQQALASAKQKAAGK